MEPFGSNTEGDMLGTDLFPALRVNEDGYFPLQSDGYNCGVGVCATIGILFREFLPRNDDFLFDDLFSRANMPTFCCENSGEIFCHMRLDNTWIQAPRDIEVWIGKQKIVRVRYTGPRQMRVIDSEAMTKYLREKQNRRSSRARAIRLAFKKKTGKTFKEQSLTKKKMTNQSLAKRSI
ncbi:hypothetical protein MHU86_7918 [Fragilaria crotonensis]|nr:hypothetical protein MHU86_7918 [Fragilaria crotonensis]